MIIVNNEEVTMRAETPNYSNKSAEMSTKFRMRGNQLFDQAIIGGLAWEHVIYEFTRSVAFAPNGSRELALAYANRSLVLYEMNLISDCLLDIGRALDTNYPDDLKAKLYFRRGLCFRSLKSHEHPSTKQAFADARKWMEKMNQQNRQMMERKFADLDIMNNQLR